MKPTNHLTKPFYAILFLVVMSVAAGCAATNQASSNPSDAGTATTSAKKSRRAKPEEVYNPAGVWRYAIFAPNQDLEGTMRIMGEPGFFEVLLDTDQFGELRVYNLEMTGESMFGLVDIAGKTARLEGDFDGDEYSGAFTVGDDTYPMDASRISSN